MRNFVFVIFQVYIMLRTLIPVQGQAVPSSPRNVTIQVKPHHLLVTWDPPIETFGDVTMYIVSYSILPDSRITTNSVGGGSSFSLIPVDGREGRLFKIQVQAQNQVGLGNMSAARYVRIGCGKTIWLDPSAATSLLFPEMGTNYIAGVLCKWTLYTSDAYSLTFMFATIQLGTHINEPCTNAYVRIGNEERFCHAQEQGRDIVSRESNVTVIFNSGTVAAGTGFYLNIMSTVKIPGPPTSITMKSSDNAIIMTWAPPTELTLSITAYVINYSILPDGPTLSIVLGPNQFYFAIGTTRFEGKLLVIRITARTETIQGDASKPLYVRAPCHRTLDVEPGVEKNISSPNYPSPYPAGIICTWSIRTNMEATVAAKVLDFKLQDSSFCSSDYITLSINPDQSLCGVITPFMTFETVGSALDVKFVSDGEKQERGFLLQVQSKGSQRGLTSDNYLSEQLFSSAQSLPTSPVPKLQTTKTMKMTSKDVTTLGKTTLTSSNLSTSISAITAPLLSLPQAVSSKPLSPSASPASLQTIEINDHQPTLASLLTRTPLLSFENRTQSTYTRSSKSAVYSLVSLSINTKRLHSHGQVTAPTPELTIQSNDLLATGSTHLFKPNLDGLSYPVSIWLKFIPSGRVSSDEFGRELQEKLSPIFNTTEAFEDIDIVQNLLLNTSLMLIYARYNLLKTLTMMETNSTFELITYLNDTSLDIIQKENLVISGWSLNTSFVEEFRKSDKLRKEKLSNICERLVKDMKKDVCKNNYPYPVTCVVSNVYNIGVACRMECPAMGCTRCVIDNNTGTISCNDTRTPSKPESLLVPLASSMGGACVVVGLLVGCITRRNRRRRMKLNLQSERQPHVEMVDMFQHESSHWHATSSLTPNQRAILANRRASFPNVRGVKVNKEVERGMRQFETFIDDKESLRKRLNKKHSIRRTNSF